MARWNALSAESRETFWRSLQALNATRVVIALVLLVYLTFDNKSASENGFFVYAETCIAYLVLAILFAVLTVNWRRRFLLQLAGQIAVDLTVISLLYVAVGGVRSGL